MIRAKYQDYQKVILILTSYIKARERIVNKFPNNIQEWEKWDHVSFLHNSWLFNKSWIYPYFRDMTDKGMIKNFYIEFLYKDSEWEQKRSILHKFDKSNVWSSIDLLLNRNHGISNGYCCLEEYINNTGKKIYWDSYNVEVNNVSFIEPNITNINIDIDRYEEFRKWFILSYKNDKFQQEGAIYLNSKTQLDLISKYLKEKLKKFSKENIVLNSNDDEFSNLKIKKDEKVNFFWALLLLEDQNFIKILEVSSCKKSNYIEIKVNILKKFIENHKLGVMQNEWIEIEIAASKTVKINSKEYILTSTQIGILKKFIDSDYAPVNLSRWIWRSSEEWLSSSMDWLNKAISRLNLKIDKQVLIYQPIKSKKLWAIQKVE